jgi:hypothetical protein
LNLRILETQNIKENFCAILILGAKIAPRELFSQDMSPVRDVADLHGLNGVANVEDRRESSETFILDRRASNETYVADHRLSMDTYVLSNSSLDVASVEVAQSPIPRGPTPAFPDLAEETLDELESIKDVTAPVMTRDELRDTVSYDKKLSLVNVC